MALKSGLVSLALCFCSAAATSSSCSQVNPRLAKTTSINDQVSLLQVVVREHSGRDLKQHPTDDSDTAMLLSQGVEKEELIAAPAKSLANADTTMLGKADKISITSNANQGHDTAMYSTQATSANAVEAHLPVPRTGMMEEIQEPETFDGLMRLGDPHFDGNEPEPEEPSSLEDLMSLGSEREAETVEEMITSRELFKVEEKKSPAKKAKKKARKAKKAEQEKMTEKKASKELEETSDGREYAARSDGLDGAPKEHAPKSDGSSGAASSTEFALDRYPALFTDLKAVVLKARKKPKAAADGMAAGGGGGGGKYPGNPWDDWKPKAKDKKKKKPEQSPLLILSFGTGDTAEAMTLRKYFPKSIITGIDHDAAQIAENIKKNTDGNVTYFTSADKLPKESFDVVIAMSSLCAARKQEQLPYEDWAKSMELLDTMVKPGGFLVAYNSNYPFDEYKDANRYKQEVEGCAMGTSPAGMSLDVKGSKNPHDWQKGECNNWGKHCFESGWRPKWNHEGKQVQNIGNGGFSLGCMYPGAFFQKVQPTPK